MFFDRYAFAWCSDLELECGSGGALDLSDDEPATNLQNFIQICVEYHVEQRHVNSSACNAVKWRGQCSQGTVIATTMVSMVEREYTGSPEFLSIQLHDLREVCAC